MKNDILVVDESYIETLINHYTNEGKIKFLNEKEIYGRYLAKINNGYLALAYETNEPFIEEFRSLGYAIAYLRMSIDDIIFNINYYSNAKI